jgi:hypothetical protein
MEDAEVTTKRQPNPNPNPRSITSLALPTPVDVSNAYQPRSATELKKSFGKDGFHDEIDKLKDKLIALGYVGAASPPEKKAAAAKLEAQIRKMENERFSTTSRRAKDGGVPKWQPDSPDHNLLDKLHNSITSTYGGRHSYSSSAGKGEIHHVYTLPEKGFGKIAERKNGQHGMGFSGVKTKATDALRPIGV